ncbi:histone-lysine N-methyltransferase EZA1 [Silene latifolia]|uniref:histone-lysine N-methyltransferase EZA1 n=1 Tax=Silene latifolia TaxID=37657 RepID=UPI003D783A0A
MASKASDSSSKHKISLDELIGRGYASLISKIRQLKVELEAGRERQVKEKLDKNGKELQNHTHKLFSAACMVNSSVENSLPEVPRLGIESALCVLHGFPLASEEEDRTNTNDAISSNSVTLSKIQRIPRYTTWIFLDRNQRMVDNQSVVGRRRIYYEQSGSEALICSDSEDDLADIEEEKREFKEGEDRILWMAFREHGLNEDVADVVRYFIGGTSSEIMERYDELKLKLEEESRAQGSTERNVLLGKSLGAALDSLDNLFCRRCLVFNCRLHECSQTLIYPSEKLVGGIESDERRPCSDQCYRVAGQTADNPVDISNFSSLMEGNIIEEVFSTKNNVGSDNADKVGSTEPVTEGSTKGVVSSTTDLSIDMHTIVGKRKTFNDKGEQLQSTDSIKASVNKKQNKIQRTDIIKGLRSSEWKPLEKDLYTKGVEIFGKNSCMIARNLLSGLKTCTEVFNYMRRNEAAITQTKDTMHCLEDCDRADADNTERNILSRSISRMFRKRGRTRRLKNSSKSNALPSSWKRLGDDSQARKQYTPCTCQSMCGKDCSCLKIGTCCEKYCGCSKGCKNRFRGCHCAKSQCRSRQCPCFAANRECDPDVCRNCWVSCGGGSLGEPVKKGDGQCGNMKLLLRQQKRVLLGRSDVTGWGAFIKDAVNKNEYLGEYTGELISDREADKRGKIYDRADSSFLFNLNDRYVLDACRQGDKLKFANHSSKPNCYCKVMLVGGEHRVGIFAKERIEAQEELFYDYCYGPAQAPPWALRPGTSKKDDSLATQNRPRKHQSR